MYNIKIKALLFTKNVISMILDHKQRTLHKNAKNKE